VHQVVEPFPASLVIAVQRPARVLGVIAQVPEVQSAAGQSQALLFRLAIDPDSPIVGLDDSKKLTEQRREALFDEIQQKATSWCIARATVAEIDRLNILHASLLAMKRAVQGLHIAPEHVLVDGNKLPPWSYSAEAVIQGDGRVPAIGAASILETSS
jgi:ribonuclease HII